MLIQIQVRYAQVGVYSMKKIYITIISLYISLLCVACASNEKIDNDTINDEQVFKENVEKVIDLIYEVDISEYQNKYNLYFVYKDLLSGYNYNNKTLNYDMHVSENIEKYDLTSGIIVQKDNNQIYASIANDNFCALKDFNDDKILIYSIDNQKNCHKFYTYDEEISLNINSYALTYDFGIASGTVIDDDVLLQAFNNVIDYESYTYKWYRNGEAIADSNVNRYVVVKEYEDADYYVEMITNEGDVIKSNTINVKIAKH